jgi:tetratricopeptide (TPR) repeat protein
MTLNNLAVLHKDEQRYDEASRKFEEALTLYRALIETGADAYLPYVAGTLNNLATLYHEENKYAEALKNYEETLKIRRDLHRQAPDAYAPDLSMTLVNLAMFYQAAMPEREKSVACAVEAIILLIPYRQTVPYTQKYTQAALGVLIEWGLTDEEIQRLIVEKQSAGKEINGSGE